MIIVAGAGPGHPKYLTRLVEDKLLTCKKVLGFGRLSRGLETIREDIVKVDTVAQVLDELQDEGDILILASGDPNFYGIVNYLKKNGVEIHEVIPGLSSFQYMMGKLQMSWHDAKLLSLHGREVDFSSIGKKTVFLTDKEHTPNFISKTLESLGLRGQIYAGYDLSYETEYIERKAIGDDMEDMSSLAVVVVEIDLD